MPCSFLFRTIFVWFWYQGNYSFMKSSGDVTSSSQFLEDTVWNWYEFCKRLVKFSNATIWDWRYPSGEVSNYRFIFCTVRTSQMASFALDGLGAEAWRNLHTHTHTRSRALLVHPLTTIYTCAVVPIACLILATCLPLKNLFYGAAG